jgi:hypothetical protein
LATVPIAFAIHLYLTRRGSWAALGVSVLAFATLLLSDILSIVNQAPYIIMWDIWDQPLLIIALPTMVWSLDVLGSRRRKSNASDSSP